MSARPNCCGWLASPPIGTGWGRGRRAVTGRCRGDDVGTGPGAAHPHGVRGSRPDRGRLQRGHPDKPQLRAGVAVPDRRYAES